jgi:hypothetical protein
MLGQKLKGRILLSNAVLVKDDCVVSKPTELKPLDGGDHAPDVVFLPKYAEAKDEYRVLRVHLLEAVIPALVGIYDEIAKGIHSAFIPLRHSNG